MHLVYDFSTTIRRLVCDMQATAGLPSARAALADAAGCLGVDTGRPADTAGCLSHLERATVLLQGHTEHAQVCRMVTACKAVILAEKAVDVAKPWPAVRQPQSV